MSKELFFLPISKLLIVVLGCLLAIQSHAQTIDRVSIATYGYHSQSYDTDGFSFEQKLMLGDPDIYHLSDGSTWDSGVGTFYSYEASLNSVLENAGKVVYVFDAPADGRLWDYTDYNSGNHSSKGILSLVDDSLFLVAEKDSNTATLRGFLEVTSNSYSSYADSRFNFYTAEVGLRIPFAINYVLVGDNTWTANIFDSEFTYSLNGSIDFTEALIDSDGDGVPDINDAFPHDATESTDSDNDDVGDNSDNCLLKPNNNQRDTDGDGFGNFCDGDLENSGFVNLADLLIFKNAYGTNHEHADFDGSGLVNLWDLLLFKTLYGKKPGPSAIIP